MFSLIKKNILFWILLVTMAAVEPACTATAQSSDHRNYNKFRERFIQDYFYDGLVAESISLDRTSITFADQTLYQGLALLAFATEEAVCRRFGRDPGPAIEIQRKILAAIDDLDLQAEPALGLGAPTANGFFLRDNITGPDDPRLQGRFRIVGSNYQSIKFGVDHYAPSSEQLFGLWFGLHAVVDFSSDAALQKQARQISTRLYDYAARTGFILRHPDGSAIRHGADMRVLASIAHGIQAITTQDRWDDAWIADIIDLEDEALNSKAQIATKQAIVAFGNSLTVPGTLQSAGEEELFLSPALRLLLGFRPNEWVEPFSMHLALMAIASNPSQRSHEKHQPLAMSSRHYVAVLLGAYRSRQLTVELSFEQIEALLDACPDTGPSGQNATATGWSHCNRWVHCLNTYDEANYPYDYNGLDWLLLHNLTRMR